MFKRENKKILAIIFCLSLVAVFYSIKQNIFLAQNATTCLTINEKEPLLDIDRNKISSTINDITSYTRDVGSEGEIIAANYLKNKLEEYGYKVNFQEFNVYNSINHKKPPVKSMNIIGQSKNFKKNKKNLYITAHYDSVEITTGVIDNATGVATVLELARILQNYNKDCNIIPIFFGAEESGLVGSDFFVTHLKESEKKNAIGCINFDMVGVIDSGDIVIWTYDFNYRNKGLSENDIDNHEGTKNIMALMINRDRDKKFKNKKFKDTLTGGTDAIPFYMEGIPSVTLINERPNMELSFNEDGEAQLKGIKIGEITNLCKEFADFFEKFNLKEYESNITKPEHRNTKNKECF